MYPKYCHPLTSPCAEPSHTPPHTKYTLDMLSQQSTPSAKKKSFLIVHFKTSGIIFASFVSQPICNTLMPLSSTSSHLI